MKLTFLGTNGWYATGTGNTVSAVIETKQSYIVLDAGDGLHKLDKLATNPDKQIDIFLSHAHLDHIIGLHTLPKFRFKKSVRIFCDSSTKNALKKTMCHPFTAPLSWLKTKVSLHELKMGRNNISGYIVECRPLIHAGPCLGFRFEVDGKVIGYCSDTGPCANIVKLGKNADILITECAILPKGHVLKKWPHLGPEMAAGLAKKARCKKLILTHFDAFQYDTMKKRMAAQKAARKIFRNTLAAMDMMKI